MTTRIWIFITALLMVLSFVVVGCEQKTEGDADKAKTPAGKTTTQPEADSSVKAEPGAKDASTAKAEPPKKEEPVPGPAPDAGGEYIKFLVNHHDKDAPVEGSFKTFKLLKAMVDLNDLTKATAEFEIDIASVDTGNEMRDGHLQKPDIFDVAKFAKATFKVHSLAKGAGPDEYTATATFNLHGASKDLPVRFKVVEKGADGSITVEGTSTLNRVDYGVGPSEGEGLNAKNKVDLMVRLKLTNM